MSWWRRLLGDYNQKKINEYRAIVDVINHLEKDFESLSDQNLKDKTAEFKKRLSAGETEDDLLPEAFALVREAARRTLGERHFDVQLIGGIVMHNRGIAEMKTGEGKTLVATLPAYLNALSGQGVHIVTVNDYLARRDAVWMGQIFAFLGLSVSVINHDTAYLYDQGHSDKDEERDEKGGYKVFYEFLRPATRHEAYLADITYGTNNEFGFDYLRDNLAYDVANVSQRTDKHGRYNYAIIDEVDSILIDEARTPLIISAPVAESESLYGTFAGIANRLEEVKDYSVDRKLKAISLTDEGISKAENILGLGDIYTEKGVKYVHHLETAVRAKALFERDKDYVVKDGEVIIVDEFTGRLQPGRRWSEGLHQAIEAKEGVKVKEESRTFATVTLQNYFRLYHKLAGMTGTAMTSGEEFLKVYGLEVVAIPTNRPSRRQDYSDLIFQTDKGKMIAVTKKIKELQTKGQPVLVGTASIEKNEILSAYLNREGLTHKVLNAKNHEQEGQIIAQAGQVGSIVIATNMAGRGVDIKLGGPEATPEESEHIKSLGGLFVLGTERHEARRIDNQLRGRSGRQGDPGETQFFISLEDRLMKVFAPERIKSMMGRFGIPEDEPIQNRFVNKALENAQSKIEGMNFDMRKHLLEYDDVVNHQRVTMYDRRRRILSGDEKDIKEFLERGMDLLGLTDEEKNKHQKTLDEKIADIGSDFIPNLKKAILQTIDYFWVEHLEGIDYVKNSVRLRAYGQRDPLVEFKHEGLALFKSLEINIFEHILKLIPNLGGSVKVESQSEKMIYQSAKNITNQNSTSTIKKVGRNDPCPCGSGKKYKKCHGK